jgi:hypothetical protein
MVTKVQYDGEGRVTKTFTTDGGTAKTRAQSSALIQCSSTSFSALPQTAALTAGPQLTARLAGPVAV